MHIVGCNGRFAATAGSTKGNTRVSTVETLRQMITEEFELDPEKVQPETALGSLGIDSLSVAEFIFSVEDKFNVTLPEPRVDMKDLNAARASIGLWTLRDIATELDVLIAAQNGSPASPPSTT